MLYLSDVNDNAPSLQSHSRYLEVCESARDKPLLLEAEDSDLHPYSDPFTFDLDSAQRDVEDTWMLRTKQGEGLYELGANPDCNNDLGWGHWVTQSQETLGEPKDQSVLCGRPARLTYQVPERTLGMKTGVGLLRWSIACMLSLVDFLTPWKKMTVCSVLFCPPVFIYALVHVVNSSHGSNSVHENLEHVTIWLFWDDVKPCVYSG